ncbi:MULTISPECIES: TniQ family protein [Methylomonas]|uniref:TniQ family protein n=1 Tax=Methylomonas albis TaxID=1854563 RepID=A0ABR9D6L6_9GAMM|nr:TniQ family protein [Methylomonas albis]
MLIPFDDYPIRPQMKHGESLLGYVYRFYAANGHSIPADVCKWVCRLSLGLEREFDESLKVSQSVFGRSLALDNIWWIRSRLEARAGRHQDRKFRIRRGHIPVRFCTMCLSESGFHYDVFEHMMGDVCPLHRRNLISSCPKCFRRFSWRTIKSDWRCHCETPIKSMEMGYATRNGIYISNTSAFASFEELPFSFQFKLRREVNPSAVDQYIQGLMARLASR